MISRLLISLSRRKSEQTLQKYADEYKVAKERAASYRREMKRMEIEVKNLRGNLTTGVMSDEQLKWLDEQIQERLARIGELADLESQPIGSMIGNPLPGYHLARTNYYSCQTSLASRQ